MGGERGFDRGFAVYRRAPSSRRQAYGFDMRATVGTALAWLGERDPAKPFFLFLHAKPVHANTGNRSRRPLVARDLLRQPELRLERKVRGREITLDRETTEHLRFLGHLR